MKRFLMMSMAVALTAIAVIGLTWGSTSVSAAPQRGFGSHRTHAGTRAGGQVDSISGTTITVTGRNGKSQAILMTASTTVTLDGKASNLSAIAVGQFLVATGTTDSAGAFTATAIHARTAKPHARPGHVRPRP